MTVHQVFVSIGSNLDRRKNIITGLEELREHFGDLQLSSIYESVPVGIKSSRNYYNLVAGFKTELTPVQLYNRFKKIEKRAGKRDRTNCPLDIDLLLYDDLIDRAFELDIPRKDITEYAFVAIPLAEIAGDQLHPETGESFEASSKTDEITSQEIWRSDFQDTQHPGEME